MNDGKIAVRYAKALFQYATEKAALEEVNTNLRTLYSMLLSSEELRLALRSPLVPAKNKLAVLQHITPGFSPAATDFLGVLVKSRREEHLEAIIRQFIALYNKQNNIVEATLITAKPVDENTRKRILTFLQGHFKARIELEEQIEAEIIGGFMLRAENIQLDASVATRLKKVKKQLVDQPING